MVMVKYLALIATAMCTVQSVQSAASQRYKRQFLSRLIPNFPAFQPIGLNTGGGVDVQPLTDVGDEVGIDGLGDFSLNRGGQVDVADLKVSGGQKNCFAGVCFGGEDAWGNVDGQGTFGRSTKSGLDLSNFDPSLSLGAEDTQGYNPWTGSGSSVKRTNLPFGIGIQQTQGFSAPGINDFLKMFSQRSTR